MGCGSSQDREADYQLAVSQKKHTDKKLAANKQVRLLLLGTGEAGKSTILKQMRLHHVGGYTPEERDGYREIIYSNLLESMQVVIRALSDLKISIPDSLVPTAAFIAGAKSASHQARAPVLDQQVTRSIIALWESPEVRTCVARSREYQLNDSAPYYFDSAERVGAVDYTPTDQDILRSRVKTTGLTEERFMVGLLQYIVFDLGGQRSERKKWIHAFENVNVLIFLVAISEYDQVLYEDYNVNRMNEAASLFESISNSSWFAETSVILFMNKTDIFRAKLISSPIDEFFSDYTGPSDYPTACAYMKSKFRPLYRNGSIHPLQIIFTCATDTEQLKAVFNAVEENIMTASLMDAGLI